MSRDSVRWITAAFVSGLTLLTCGCARSILSADAPTGAASSTIAAVPDQDTDVSPSPADIPAASSSAFPPATNRIWRRTQIPLAVSGSASDCASFEGASCDTVTTARDCGCENRFHFTTIRGWFFQDFVPDKSDPTTFGLELDSAFGLGRFDVANITYVELADYPNRVPGRPVGNAAPGFGAATGINDVLTAFLFSKKGVHHGPHHFALGFAAQFPTASDSTLGSGKWSVGPAAEYEYERGRFYAAFVALNVISVAGDEKRKDVNMFMLKPMLTYELSSRWKLVYMPYGISVYWNKPINDAVYVPVGGGVQYDFRLGSQKMAVSVQLFQYVVRPRSGSEHDLRFMLEADF